MHSHQRLHITTSPPSRVENTALQGSTLAIAAAPGSRVQFRLEHKNTRAADPEVTPSSHRPLAATPLLNPYDGLN